jgi:predicted amidophosphoribosyltransferase
MILNPTEDLLLHWRQTQAEAVIAIPQRFSRAWKMRGSRAEKIASWVAFQMQIPVLTPFSYKPTQPSQKRQAQLSFEGRFQKEIEFFIAPERKSEFQSIRHILLVDDFMTTGRTLQQAASLLKSLGLREIHVFCLGIRAFQVNP